MSFETTKPYISNGEQFHNALVLENEPQQESTTQSVVSSACSILTLPQEILLEIFEQLSTEEYLAVTKVCTQFLATRRFYLLRHPDLLSVFVRQSFLGEYSETFANNHPRSLMAQVKGLGPDVKSLRFLNCTFTTGELKNLVHLFPQLKELFLQNSSFSAKGLTYLASLQLEKLNVNSSYLRNEQCSFVDLFLKKQTALREVSLTAHQDIQGRWYALLRCLGQLQAITLRKCGWFGDKKLNTLVNNTLQLQRLDVSHCYYLHDKGFLHLKRLKNLRYLNLCHSYITDVGLKVLEELPHLEELDISSCSGITSKGFSYIVGLKQLKVLTYGDNVRINFANITFNRPGLKYIRKFLLN